MARRGRIRKDVGRVGLTTLLVRPRAHEPAYSILQRLAARAGMQSVKRFLQTVRFCPTWLDEQVRRGRDLDAVAALSGLPLASFLPHTVVGTPEGTFVGEVLVATAERLLSPMPGRGRVCPLCLDEDGRHLDGPVEGRPYRRFWWDLPAVHGCPDHLVGLVLRCPCCGERLDWRRPRPDLCPCGCDLARASGGPTAAASFDPCLRRIMLGGPAPAWADGMSVSTMSGLALRVGVVDVLGPQVKEITTMEAVRRMELAAAGADRLAGGGVTAFSAVLDRCVARDGARLASANLAYGELQRWLARQDDAALGPYRGALLDHARVHLRPGRDVTFLGHVLARPGSRGAPRRHGMTVAARREAYVGPLGSEADAEELALELRCSRERVVATARMIEPEMVVPDGAGPLPPALVAGIRALLANVGTTREARSRLGLSQPQFVRLLRADDRDRVPKPLRRGADLFRMAPLQAFLDHVTADAPRFAEVPSGMVPLMKAGSLNRRWPDVYRVLRDGGLRAAGSLTGRVGLNAILLTIADVRRAVAQEVDWAPTLSIAQARDRLDLSGATVTALRRAGLLVYAPRPANGRTTRGPTVESIERLERDHVSARELAAVHGMGVRPVMALLEGGGVERVVSGGKDVQAVYLRNAASVVLNAVERDVA